MIKIARKHERIAVCCLRRIRKLKSSAEDARACDGRVVAWSTLVGASTLPCETTTGSVQAEPAA